MGFVLCSMGDLPRPGIKPLIPCIGGLVLTLDHQGSPAGIFNWQSENHFYPFSLLQFDQKGLSNQQAFKDGAGNKEWCTRIPRGVCKWRQNNLAAVIKEEMLISARIWDSEVGLE